NSDIFSKEICNKYKPVSMSPLPPPLKIQVLIYLLLDLSRLQIKPKPKYILLQSWVLSL
ncbi:hypothetical protein EDD85DRAFT_726745, partial [Armillaria nabsnona]